MTLAANSRPIPSGPLRAQSGYNHNFKYGGRVFHVQTEDYGRPRCFVCSHIFVDGQVIQSAKTPYPQDLSSEALHQEVRRLMQDSHRKMFYRIKDGEFDRVLEQGQETQLCRTDAASLGIDRGIGARRRSTTRELAPENIVVRADFDQIGIAPQSESALANLCEELSGLLCLAYFSPARQEFYSMQDLGINPNPALKTVVDLAEAQLKSMKDLQSESADFQLVAQSAEHCYVLLPATSDSLLYLVLDRQINLAMVMHKVNPVLKILRQYPPHKPGSNLVA